MIPKGNLSSVFFLRIKCIVNQSQALSSSLLFNFASGEALDFICSCLADINAANSTTFVNTMPATVLYNHWPPDTFSSSSLSCCNFLLEPFSIHNTLHYQIQDTVFLSCYRLRAPSEITGFPTSNRILLPAVSSNQTHFLHSFSDPDNISIVSFQQRYMIVMHDRTI